MYIIQDLQFEDRFFGGTPPEQFKTKKEAIEQLISYHENDCNMSVEKKLLKQGKIKQAQTAVEAFEWAIIKVKKSSIFIKDAYEEYKDQEIDILKNKI